MNVKNIVAHKINKVQGAQDANIQYAGAELNVSDQKVIKFAKGVRDLYTKGTSKSFGNFEETESDNNFQGFLNEFNNDDVDFLSFTRKAVDNLKIHIQSQTLATGGYIVFMRYVEEAEYAMVLMLKDKKSPMFTSSLTLSDATHIDLDKLHAVVRINVSKMQADEQQYLSFTKNSRVKEFAEYFLKFIGCTDFTESKALTSTFVDQIKKYAKTKATNDDGTVDKAYKDKIINSAYTYCEEKYKDDLPVNIESLSRLLDPEEPTNFTDYIADNNIVLNTEFTPHKETIKRLKKYHFTGNGFSLRFDRDCIDTNIIIDKENKKLTINLTESDISELEL